MGELGMSHHPNPEKILYFITNHKNIVCFFSQKCFTLDTTHFYGQAPRGTRPYTQQYTINIKQTQRHPPRSFVSSYSIKIVICFASKVLFLYSGVYVVCFYGSPMCECMCLFLHVFLALFLFFPNLFSPILSYFILFYLISVYSYSLVPFLSL